MIQFSEDISNARLDAIESTVGTDAILKIYIGAPPENVAAADGSTVLVSITLPADWMDAAASGSVSMLGTWTADAVASGIAGHFRLFASDDTTVHMQGNVRVTGEAGDMTISDVNIVIGKAVTVTSFTLTDGNL